MRRSAASCSNRRAKQKAQHIFITCWAFSSGDVLLSHDLSSHYHRGCSVSLPCSEWERVVPLRYNHQRSEPDWRFAATAATQARVGISDDDVDRTVSKEPLVLWYLHTGSESER